MHTIRYYPYEAGRTLYPIDFMLGILSRSHVYVYTGEDYLEQVSYTWINDGQISLNTPLTVGQELKIQRKLPTSLFNDFENGARLSAKNLDSSFLQALMLHEEVLDGFLGNEFRLQSLNFIVKNLEVLNSLKIQEATEPNEATTKNYVDSLNNALKDYVDTSDSNILNYINTVVEEAILNGFGSNYVGETPPTFLRNGIRWYKPSETTTYVYYCDGDSCQWVQEPVQSAEGTLRQELGAVDSTVQVGGVGAGDLVLEFDTKEFPPFNVTNSVSNDALQAYVSANRGGKQTSVTDLINMPSLYPYYKGQGDQNPINISLTGGFRYVYAIGEFDDHAHRKVSDTRFVGTGSQTLYLHENGSYAEFDNNVFQGGSNGLVIRDAYTCSGHKNHYKGCVNGLLLDNTTSFTEYEIYARGNTTAAIRIQGATNEDVNLIGGAIEGNRGSAIKVDAGVGSQFRLNIQNVYFELDGDTFGGATTPSIDVPLIDEAVHTRFIGGKLSYNSVAGWISGDYNFGYNVMFAGTKISGVLNSQLMKFTDGCRLDDATLNNNGEPTFVADWDASVKFTSGFGATRGYVFSCPVIGKAARNSPIPNNTKTAHPYIAVLGTGPVLAEDTVSNYGDGSWTQATFAASVGSYGSNSVFIGNTVDGNQKQRIYSFLIKSDRDTTVQFLESQTGTAIQSTHQLKAGVVYKMVCIANKVIAGTQRLALFPTVGNAPVISVLCLRQSQFNDTTVTRASALVSQIVRGVI